MEYAVTFNYYDKKGRRLATFCRFLNATEAEIFTLTCSKEDQFNKKYARKVYEAYLAGVDVKFEFHKPTIELVIIKLEQGELQTLLEFCRENYYLWIPVEIPGEILANPKRFNNHYQCI